MTTDLMTALHWRSGWNGISTGLKALRSVELDCFPFIIAAKQQPTPNLGCCKKLDGACRPQLRQVELISVHTRTSDRDNLV